MGTISIEHGDRLFWLGRYTERAFTTLKSLESLYDKAIDCDPEKYKEYLSALVCVMYTAAARTSSGALFSMRKIQAPLPQAYSEPMTTE